MASASEPGTPQAFHFDSHARVFRIDGGETTYAFGINSRGELESLYWGGRLLPEDPLPAQSYWPIFETDSASTPQEFAGWGGGLYVEPALKISFPDGNRDLVLHYVSHAMAADALEVTLKDISCGVFVTLRYSVDAETGVIGRSAVIQNKTESPLMVEQAAAGTFNLPAGDQYELSYLTGDWASDFNVRHRGIAPGKTVLESRRGSTSQQNNPWFAIERTRSNDEEHGAVWFGALAWSGSWSMAVEQDQAHRVRVTGGFNAFDFGYKLKPGKNCARQSSTAALPRRDWVAHPASCTVSSSRACCLTHQRRSCAASSTTRGKRPYSMSTRRTRRRWRRRRPALESSGS